MRTPFLERAVEVHSLRPLLPEKYTKEREEYRLCLCIVPFCISVTSGFMAHILPSQDEARSTTCFPYTDLWIKKATGIYFSSSFCGVCLEFLSMSLERISI